MTKIKCNNFVKRQTADSTFAHFDGTWEQLEELAMANPQNARPGDTTGILLIKVPPKGFYSSFVKLTPEMELVAKFAPRREGENSFLNVLAKGNKQPAKHVEIVVYSHALLAKDNEQTYDDTVDFEIISINASPAEVPTPMDPVTMARNYFNLPGGTKREFTDEMAKTMTKEEWLQKMLDDAMHSALYHAQHVQVTK